MLKGSRTPGMGRSQTLHRVTRCMRVASDLIATVEPLAQTNAVRATCCR